MDPCYSLRRKGRRFCSSSQYHKRDEVVVPDWTDSAPARFQEDREFPPLAESPEAKAEEVVSIDAVIVRNESSIAQRRLGGLAS